MDHDRQPPLSALGVRTYVSLSGLEAVLRQLHQPGLLNFEISMRTLKRCRDQDIRVPKKYGDLVRTLDLNLLNGNTVQVPYVHPASWSCSYTYLTLPTNREV